MSEEIKNTNVKNNENREVTSENNGSSAMDYKLIVDMVKEMESNYKMCKDMITSAIASNFSLDEAILEKMLTYTNEDIDNMSDTDIRELLTKYSLPGTDSPSVILETRKSLNSDNEENVSDEDALREAVKSIKKESVDLYSLKAESDSIKDESQEILNDYINYATSDKIKEKRAARLEAMKAAAEISEDGPKKIAMQKMIDAIEASQTLSFIYKRFNELGDKEIKSIVTSYFDNNKGAYVIKRFKNNITKFGFSENLFRYFFNLEENFLDEYYHPFNNLFLFIYMRFVGYADPYSKSDKLFVQALTSSMANLVYHKFQNNEKDNFVDIMKDILDKFADYHDKFNKDNSTHPNHPKRIEADSKREIDRKTAMIAKMDELNITGYDKNSTADEMQAFMNEKLDELIKKQNTKTDESVEEVNETSEE